MPDQQPDASSQFKDIMRDIRMGAIGTLIWLVAISLVPLFWPQFRPDSWIQMTLVLAPAVIWLVMMVIAGGCVIAVFRRW